MNERSLFLAAVEIEEPAARAAFLDAACGGDPRLRERIDELLSAHAATGFMARPAADRGFGSTIMEAGSTAPSPSLVGTLLAGRFMLGPELGSGGMGTVHRAEQVEPIKRSVAVKLVRPGMDSGLVLARFEAERQALALMDHPNIARVLDAGQAPDGRPFFVMDLVEGVPLTTYCDEHRLPVADRLDLFRQICRAVQHAHQKGVIHRDLKPSNVLVEGGGSHPTAKVIDFGLAKAVGGTVLTEQTLLTVHGSFAGSPLYMAPEQAGAEVRDVDVRADVYALGAILYELLTGSTPIPRDRLADAALAEVARLVREDEPPAPSDRLGSSDALPSVAANRGIEPSRLGRLVRGDLDWIVLKSLEKDRDRRYDSAAALAEDVERFLNHEPVSAGPPTVSYRAWKFARRHRAAVVAAALVLAALVAGVAGTTWGLVREAAQRRRAERATERAYRALDALTEDVLEGLLGRQASWSDRERAFLSRVQSQFEELATVEDDADAARPLRASARLRLGSIRSLFGDLAAAEADYRASASEFRRLAGPRALAGEAQAGRRLGGLLSRTGRAAAAQVEFARAADAYDRLAADFPSDRTYSLGAALVRNDSGFTHLEAGEFEAAEADCRSAADRLAQLVAAEPAEPTYPVERARALHNLYMVLRRTGRTGEAERTIAEAVDLLRGADAKGRDPRVKLALGKALQSRAAILIDGGDLSAAEPVQREVVAVHAALAADYPSAPEYRHELARGQQNLGILFGRFGKVDAALSAYRDAASTALRLADDFPETTAYQSFLAHVRLAVGEELAAAGRDEEAGSALAEALPVWEKLRAGAPGSPANLAGLVATLVRLGGVALARKDDARALTYLERADRCRKEAPGMLGMDPTGAVAEQVLVAYLVPVRLARGEHASAAVLADEMAGFEGPNAAVQTYNAGCCLARCASLAAEDPDLAPDRRKALAEEYARRAVVHLRSAFSKGYKDHDQFDVDADLAPLRSRPDFKELASGRR